MDKDFIGFIETKIRQVKTGKIKGEFNGYIEKKKKRSRF